MILQALTFISSLVLCAFLTSCASTAQKSSAQFTRESTAAFFSATTTPTLVHRYQLANGLKVLILEDHSAPTFAYQTWFSVGSKDETPGRTGLAHLFEHMMFKETKNLKDGVFDRTLEAAGAEGENAFTSRDYTGYVQSLPSDKLELIISLESERMVNLLVNDESLNKEREVVQNERRFREENNPDGQLYERLYELAFQKHSYHWPVIGYDNDLKQASAKDCLDFYKRFYAPNNATISIVGDVNPHDTIKLIEKYYGKTPVSIIQRNKIEEEPPQHSERRETKYIKTPIEKLMLAYRIPSLMSPEFSNLEIIRNLLAGGKSSRLYKRLVDGGIASGVEIENEEKAFPGLFIIFVNMQKNKTAQQALEAIEAEFKHISQAGFSAEEIQTAISLHRFTVFDGLVSNQAKSHFLGFYETVGGRFERGVEIAESIKTASNDQIVKTFKRYFLKNNRTTVIGLPIANKNQPSKKDASHE